MYTIFLNKVSRHFTASRNQKGIHLDRNIYNLDPVFQANYLSNSVSGSVDKKN